MIKAEYHGTGNDLLLSRKVYKIFTKCIGNRLVVFVGGVRVGYVCLSYACLEQFLKEWRIKAVYHE